MRNLDLIGAARQSMTGYWFNSIIVVIIWGLLSSAPQSIDYTYSIVTILINGALNVGVAVFFLRVIQKKDARIENIFDGFRKYVPSLLAYILFSVIVIVGFVFLIIPGVILALGLSQTFYIIADDENNISGVDALKKSWEMMDGYKIKFLLLNIIHLGMIILGFMALFIGLFYVLPIIYSSLALFYDKLKKGELLPS